MAGGMKRLAKETAVYGLSSIIGRFLNWMLVPMYTRVFTDTGDFGIVTNLYAWVALLLVLLTFGMETGFFRFINKKEETEPMRVYATTMAWVGGLSGTFLLLSLLFLQPIADALRYTAPLEYLGMMLGITAVDAFCCIPFAYLRYAGQAYRFAGIKLLGIFLNIFLNIFFLVICPWLYTRMPEAIGWFYRPDYGVGYVFVANVITTGITFLCLLPSMLPGFKARPNGTLLKEMLHYSFPILILGIAGIFNQTADKILFPLLFDDKTEAYRQLGIYGACFKVAVVMVMFIQAFRYAYEPFIFAKNKSEGNTKAYAEAMKYFIIFSLFIFLGVMFYIDIIKYFVGSRYYDGLQVVPIVMLGEFFFGIYFNLSFWYKLIDQTQWGAYFSIIGCAATVAIIILFAPTYGYMACAWASFCCNLLMMLLSYFIGQKKYPIAYDLRSAALYFGLAAVLYVVGMYVPYPSIGVALLVRTVLLIGFVAFVIRRDLPLTEIPYIGNRLKRS